MAASWLTRFTDSWAAMVAGSGYPLVVILVTLVKLRWPPLPAEKAIAGILRPTAAYLIHTSCQLADASQHGNEIQVLLRSANSSRKRV